MPSDLANLPKEKKESPIDEDAYLAIGDRGAGAAVGSIRALKRQGGNSEQIQQRIEPLPVPQTFNTANGTVKTEHGLKIKTQGRDETIMHLLQDSPMAFSVGEAISRGNTLVWQPQVMPYFAPAKYVRVSCPKSRRYEAACVKQNVPHWRVRLSNAPKRWQPHEGRVPYKSGGSRFYTEKHARNQW